VRVCSRGFCRITGGKNVKPSANASGDVRTRGVKRKYRGHTRNVAFDPIRKCAAPLADRPHARSWGYSAVARGRSEGVVFGSEHVDRGETRLRCDAVPKVNCKADVTGPKGIPSAAND
jgi:hypothetical protein